MFSVCYILTQRMSALEIFNDGALYKCSLNNNNNNNNNFDGNAVQIRLSTQWMVHLRRLRHIRRTLSKESAATLVHAFVHGVSR